MKKCVLCDEEFENKKQDICLQCFEEQDDIKNQIMEEKYKANLLDDKRRNYL